MASGFRKTSTKRISYRDQASRLRTGLLFGMVRALEAGHETTEPE